MKLSALSVALLVLSAESAWAANRLRNFGWSVKVFLGIDPEHDFSVERMVQVKKQILKNSQLLGEYKEHRGDASLQGVGACPLPEKLVKDPKNSLKLYRAIGGFGKYEDPVTGKIGPDFGENLKDLKVISFLFYIGDGKCGAVLATRVPPGAGDAAPAADRLRSGSRGSLPPKPRSGICSNLFSSKSSPRYIWDFKFLSRYSGEPGTQNGVAGELVSPLDVRKEQLIDPSDINTEVATALEIARKSTGGGFLRDFTQVALSGSSDDHLPPPDNRASGPIYDFKRLGIGGVYVWPNAAPVATENYILAL